MRWARTFAVGAAAVWYWAATVGAIVEELGWMIVVLLGIASVVMTIEAGRLVDRNLDEDVEREAIRARIASAGMDHSTTVRVIDAQREERGDEPTS